MGFFQKSTSYYKKLIYDNRRWVYATLVIFIVGVVSGLLISQFDPAFTKKLILQYASSIDKKLEPGWQQSVFIFKRNLSAVLIAIGTSLFFGIPSVLVAFINGLVLGLFLGFGEIHSKINPWQFFLLLFPHGIFEYSGVFLALSFGLRLGLNWLLKINKGKRLSVLKNNFRETLLILVLVIIILGLAAFVEGFLTAKIACLLSSICR